MTATTHASFHEHTEALEVAAAFPSAIRGKTILITGVNRNGLGFTTAEAFASQFPARIIITGRTLSKLQESITALKSAYPAVDYRPLTVDLSRQTDVRRAAAELLAWADVPAINIVVNSAGIMNVPERTLSEDGVELHFATNHLGHYLLTCLIMPKILAAAKTSPAGATRVVNVSSLSPTWTGIRWSDVNFDKVNKTLPADEQPPYDLAKDWGIEDPEEKAYLPLQGYNQSKVANLLFSIGLTRRLYERFGVLSLAVHPGIIATELNRSFPPEASTALKEQFEKGVYQLRTQGAGASTSVTAALDPGLGAFERRNGKENWGAYLIDCQLTDRADPRAESSESAEKLWKLSEELVKQKFEWE